MELIYNTAHQLHDLMINKKISCRELTDTFIRQIECTNKNTNVFLTTTFEEAYEKAKIVDEKIANGKKIEPLEGIPIGLKDNLCIKGVRTTAASKILDNFIAPYDAFVVKELKEVNAVLMGKLNLDEFAMGSSNETSYFGPAKNPHDLTRSSGGSSGGPAVCVASGASVISLGSDTGGSIRQPASFCGVVGMKPTYGSISRYGLIALCSSFDQIGPITRDVRDCAETLNLISKYDPQDSTCRDFKRPDYTGFLNNDVKGLKIGIQTDFLGEGINEEVRKSVLESADLLRRLGAEVTEFSMPIARYSLPVYTIICSSEASTNLARYDGIKYGYRTDNYDNLVGLYQNSRTEGFGTEVRRRILLGTYVLSSEHCKEYYEQALKVKTTITESFRKIFEKFDVILTPTVPNTAFKIGEISDPVNMYLEDLCTVPVNVAGLPAISIPCGFDSNKMPIGLQFIGKAFDEGTILKAAYTAEQNLNIDIKPCNYSYKY